MAGAKRRDSTSHTLRILLFGALCASLLTAVSLYRGCSRVNDAEPTAPARGVGKRPPVREQVSALEEAAFANARSQARPPGDTHNRFMVRFDGGGDPGGIKVYAVAAPPQDGQPRVAPGASELLGVVESGGGVSIEECSGAAAVALAYNASSFVVATINVQGTERVATIPTAAEQGFALATSSADAEAAPGGEFRFAVILNEWQSLSWPEGSDGWRHGVADFFSDYHLLVPTSKSGNHGTFLSLSLSSAAPTATARLPRKPHRLYLVSAPFGWSVLPPTSFVPGGESIELRAVQLRLRTLRLIAHSGAPWHYPKFVRLAFQERLSGGGWYSSSMIDLPFERLPDEGRVLYSLPLEYEDREVSIVVEFPEGNSAESEQFMGVPGHLDIRVE